MSDGSNSLSIFGLFDCERDNYFEPCITGI